MPEVTGAADVRGGGERAGAGGAARGTLWGNEREGSGRVSGAGHRGESRAATLLVLVGVELRQRPRRHPALDRRARLASAVRYAFVNVRSEMSKMPSPLMSPNAQPPAGHGRARRRHQLQPRGRRLRPAARRRARARRTRGGGRCADDEGTRRRDAAQRARRVVRADHLAVRRQVASGAGRKACLTVKPSGRSRRPGWRSSSPAPPACRRSSRQSRTHLWCLRAA